MQPLRITSYNVCYTKLLRLEVNASTRPGGSVAVEFLDAAGRPIEGFGASDSFAGDDLRKTLTWKGNSSVQKLAGKPISLKFHLV